ncbi:DegV family protein [Scatolibacter rhodanostii]|uniref:DegV family protein n=1 Tax=Scatolibacter rhodanostii TaxID=2014781 RepID=UPI000C080D89|nr:DegV family protein [Scatolibacter rhodanostii]
MNYKIIVDSCCDLTKKLKEKLGAIAIPLTLRLGEKEFVDDEKLDLPDFMQQMSEYTHKVASAAPSPGSYADAYSADDSNSFAITISKELSGSYASAEAAKSYTKESSNQDIHVFDSKSASAGETLVAIKLKEYIQKDFKKDEIIEKTNEFIDKMKTYFVLENYDNLQKNGRLGKIAGTLVSLLGLRLVMGSDGNGKIRLYDKARGENQILQKLLSLIKNSQKETTGETLVISHCNNEDLAKKLAAQIRRQFNFKNIHVVPTGGVSSMYADNKGIVMAF